MGGPESPSASPTGSVAAYSLDEGEGEGEVVEDAVGGHGGTIEGAEWTAGKYGSALKPDPPASGPGSALWPTAGVWAPVSPEPISVLVVDDHPLVREHVARAILADERLELAGQAGDGEEALRQVREHHPDALILDVEMPKLDGVGVLRALRGRGELPKVMLFTGHADPGQLHDAVQAGPDGLLFKTETAQICAALVAMLGEEKLAPARLNLERAQALAGARVELSAGDICILRLAAGGRSVAQTARELSVAPRTVEQMRHDVRAKLGRATIEGAIALGFAIGFLT